jgi:cell division protein FtsB
MPAAARARSRRPPPTTLARRWGAIALIALIGYAYYHPLRSWISARHALQAQRADVALLAAQKHELQQRVQSNASLDSLAREARQLGYIRPGEHLFIVKGIKAWLKAHSTITGHGK